MLVRAGINNALSLAKLSTPIVKLAQQVVPKIVGNWLYSDEESVSSSIPSTRFEAPVSPYRVWNSLTFEFETLHKFRGVVPGSTINDAVCTLISGGIRRYLEAKQELPHDSLVAMMPVNTRVNASEFQAQGNTITLTRSSIRTDVADPVERLQAINGATSNMKSFLNGVGASEMTDLTRYAPEATLAFAGKLLSMTKLNAVGVASPQMNIAISNVPGPKETLYFKGAELKHLSIVAPVIDGLGLTVGIISYNKKLFIFPTACRDIIPDPDFFCDCLQASYDEILQLVSTKKEKEPAKKDKPVSKTGVSG
jgi:WS/DGAT/MGAT family acyltransferase